MAALCTAKIARDLFLERRIDGFAEIVPQQHVFRRDRGIRLELEHPMAISLLLAKQSIQCGGDRRVKFSRRDDLLMRREIACIWQCVHWIELRRADCVRSAAWKPERIAPSIVAGKPVAV